MILDDYPPVGYEPIDRDHAEIALAWRNLLAAIRADDLPLAQRLGDALVQRAIAHFMHEKRLMEEIDYPFVERHRDAHLSFLSGARQAMEEMRVHGLTAGSLRWASETIGWFRRHVLTEDIALARMLLARRQ